MTVDAGGPLAGGTITVDGNVITVPENLLATLPSITVAWPELFSGGAADLPGGNYEAHVSRIPITCMCWSDKDRCKEIAWLARISQAWSIFLRNLVKVFKVSFPRLTRRRDASQLAQATSIAY